MGWDALVGTVVQLLNHVRFFETPWTAACQASLSFTISWSLLKLMSVSSSVTPFSSCLQSFPASGSFPVSWLFATPWTAARQVSLSFSISQTLLHSYPVSWWYHPTISSSAAPFPFCLQSFPASESFPMSRLFTSGGQSIRASASASVLLMNIQGWFPLELTGLISLQ